MSRYTSYRTGGNADILCTPKSVSELVELLKILKTESVPVYVFGNCSNVIVRDKGIRGAVILTTGLKGINVNTTQITCEAGVSLSRLANTAMNSGLTGAEPISGIPGSVGGAISMNAGSYGTEMKDIVISAAYLDEDLNIRKKNSIELCFGNRRSCFTGTDDIVLSAIFSFKPGIKEEIRMRMSEYASKRKENQPLEYPSCGSIFKRPEGYFAGKLIQDAGLKGYTVNGACISEKHAGFIINKGNATSDDILKVIDFVKLTVYNKFKVILETEVKIFGEE